LPQVTLSERANIGRLDTPFGVIRRRNPITVPTEWALMKIKDTNLLFVFEESDRKDVLGTDEKVLNMLTRSFKRTIDADTLCDMLLPKPVKRTKAKTTKAKTTTKKETPVEE